MLPDRERVTARAGVVPQAAETLPPHRREILFLANGRRTPRDIAFVIGRGVYHVTVEVSRMLGEALLQRAGRGAGGGAGVPKVWAGRVPVPRREPVAGRAVAPYELTTYETAHDTTAYDTTTPYEGGELPRRIPGASGITTRTLVADTLSGTGWNGLFRMRSRTTRATPSALHVGTPEPGTYHAHVQRGS